MAFHLKEVIEVANQLGINEEEFRRPNLILVAEGISLPAVDENEQIYSVFDVRRLSEIPVLEGRAPVGAFVTHSPDPESIKVVANVYNVTDTAFPAKQSGVAGSEAEPHRLQVVADKTSGIVDYDFPARTMYSDEKGRRYPLTMMLGDIAITATLGLFNELSFQSGTDGISFVHALKLEDVPTRQ
jgi:hypothetical protein